MSGRSHSHTLKGRITNGGSLSGAVFRVPAKRWSPVRVPSFLADNKALNLAQQNHRFSLPPKGGAEKFGYGIHRKRGKRRSSVPHTSHTQPS